MNLLFALKSLYAFNGFVAVLLYLPQIVRVWKDREHALSVSLLTFGGWCIGSFITALYAWLAVQDHIFTAISLGNMAGSGAVFAIVLVSRFSSRGRSSAWRYPSLGMGSRQGCRSWLSRGRMTELVLLVEEADARGRGALLVFSGRGRNGRRHRLP